MYPDAHCELNFSNPFQLLIATILSAQSTDRKVNQITERLFQKYSTPQVLCQITQEEFEQLLNGPRQTGVWDVIVREVNDSTNLFCCTVDIDNEKMILFGKGPILIYDIAEGKFIPEGIVKTDLNPIPD
jgi:hypothetical protein